MHKPVLGLIGGIGSGKSRVAEEFARHGGRVIAGDRLGHEGLSQPDIRDRVLERWGQAILDAHGNVERRKVAAVVFADPRELRALEAILFPWIEKRMADDIAAAQEDPSVRFVVLDAAVLLEAGWDRFCDRLVHVEAPREQRSKRIAEQRGWNEKELAARENAQLSLAEKRSRAHAVLDNSGPPEQLHQQVAALLRSWRL